MKFVILLLIGVSIASSQQFTRANVNQLSIAADSDSLLEVGNRLLGNARFDSVAVFLSENEGDVFLLSNLDYVILVETMGDVSFIKIPGHVSMNMFLINTKHIQEE